MGQHTCESFTSCQHYPCFSVLVERQSTTASTHLFIASQIFKTYDRFKRHNDHQSPHRHLWGWTLSTNAVRRESLSHPLAQNPLNTCQKRLGDVVIFSVCYFPVVSFNLSVNLECIILAALLPRKLQSKIPYS
jgi:hypothetical protein